jgi:hypothetical protein
MFVELLAEAFDQEPRRPAERDLAAGVMASAYRSFAPSREVVVAEATTPSADGHAQRACGSDWIGVPFPSRCSSRAIPARWWWARRGPSARDHLDPRLVVGELAAARDLDPPQVRRRLPAALQLSLSRPPH